MTKSKNLKVAHPDPEEVIDDAAIDDSQSSNVEEVSKENDGIEEEEITSPFGDLEAESDEERLSRPKGKKQTSFEVDAESLKKTIKFVKGVISNSPIIDILGDIRVKAEGNTMTLDTYDTQMALSGEVNIRSKKDFEFTIPYSKFYNTVSLMKGDIKIVVYEGAIEVSDGYGIFKFPIDRYENFPDIPFIEEVEASFRVKQSFITSFKEAASYTSNDDLNLKLTGVNIELNNKGDNDINMVGCDGMILFQTSFNTSNSIGKGSYIIPSYVGKYLNSQDSVIEIGNLSTLQSIEAKKGIVITSQGFKIKANLVDETYPDWKALLSDTPHHSIELARGILLSSCQKLMITASKIDNKAFFKFNDSTLNITAKNEALNSSGEVQVKCYCEMSDEVEGDNFYASVKVISDVISRMDEEMITIKFRNKNQSLVIETENEVRLINTIAS